MGKYSPNSTYYSYDTGVFHFICPGQQVFWIVLRVGHLISYVKEGERNKFGYMLNSNIKSQKKVTMISQDDIMVWTYEFGGRIVLDLNKIEEQMS